MNVESLHSVFFIFGMLYRAITHFHLAIAVPVTEECQYTMLLHDIH